MGKLHPIVNDTRGNTWCGPAAICAITGLPLSKVKAAIYEYRRERGSARPIMGMPEWEVAEVLRRLGRQVYPMRQVRPLDPDVPGPTLARWLRERKPVQMGKTYLVVVTGHFMVVRGRKVVDSRTKNPVWLSKAPRRRARVVSVRAIA